MGGRADNGVCHLFVRCLRAPHQSVCVLRFRILTAPMVYGLISSTRHQGRLPGSCTHNVHTSCKEHMEPGL